MTAHFTGGLMCDLVICKGRKEYGHTGVNNITKLPYITNPDGYFQNAFKMPESDIMQQKGLTFLQGLWCSW